MERRGGTGTPNVAIVATLNIVRSRIGRAFVTIRDQDIAAEIIGINIFRYKLIAFAISSQV